MSVRIMAFWLDLACISDLYAIFSGTGSNLGVQISFVSHIRELSPDLGVHSYFVSHVRVPQPYLGVHSYFVRHVRVPLPYPGVQTKFVGQRRHHAPIPGVQTTFGNHNQHLPKTPVIQVSSSTPTPQNKQKNRQRIISACPLLINMHKGFFLIDFSHN